LTGLFWTKRFVRNCLDRELGHAEERVRRGADCDVYENDHILFIAGHDLGRLCGGMPVEAQMFEAWYLACHPEKVRADSDVGVGALFPGIVAMDRQGRKRQGLAALRWAREQTDLKMAYSVD
jgi:hypothetical protein